MQPTPVWQEKTLKPAQCESASNTHLCILSGEKVIVKKEQNFVTMFCKIVTRPPFENPIFILL